MKKTSNGGLNIRNAYDAYIAQLAKAGSRTLLDQNKLRVQMLHDKYLKDQCILDNNMQPYASHSWKGIDRSFNFLKSGFAQTGNVISVSIWFDIWVYDEPLCLMVDDIHKGDLHLNVNSAISSYGAWGLAILKMGF